MELDELKQSWKSAAQQYQHSDYDLNSLLLKKTDGPLNVLRKKYRMQCITLPLAVLVLIITCAIVPDMRQNAFIWIAIPLMLAQTIRYYQNYQLILKMQQPADKNLKQRLEENLQTLKNEARREQYLLRIILILFIMAMEISLYYKLVPAYQGWADLSLAIRAGVYVLLIIIQPYISRYFFNFHFGQYLSRLEELVHQAS